MPAAVVEPDVDQTPAEAVPRATGPDAPQPSVPTPDAADQLGWAPVRADARVWVLGAHGGAGESTLAALLGGGAAQHRWPSAAEPVPVLLCARTHARGLRAAQLAAAAWASGQTPTIRLLGLVLVADAPGRLPKPLAQYAERVSGGVPLTWSIPWAEEYRLGPPEGPPPRSVRKFLDDVHALLGLTNPAKGS